MDDWTYPYADVDSPSTHVVPLGQDGDASEYLRDRAYQTEAAPS